MKLKKLLVLAGIVSILLILVFVKNTIDKRQLAKNMNKESAVVLIPGDPGAAASKIIIYRGFDEKDKIVFSKQVNGDWLVESKFGIKAKKELVDQLLNSVKNLKGELRGESKSIFGDFEIFDNQGLHLVLLDAKNKDLAHLVISFKRVDWNNDFVRLFGSERVILADRNVLPYGVLYLKTEKLDGNIFADYGLFAFDVDSVNKIELTDSKKRSFVLVKSDPLKKNTGGVWKFDPASPKQLPDPEKINVFLQNIVNLRALDNLDPSLAIYGFNQPLLTLKVSTLKDGKTGVIQAEVGAYLNERRVYYVRVMPANQVFVVSSYFISNIDQDKNYFISNNKASKNKKK